MGFITTGKPNFFFIMLIISFFDLLKLYLKYFGVKILFLMNIFLKSLYS